MTDDHCPWRIQAGAHYMPTEQSVEDCHWLYALAEILLRLGPPEGLVSMITVIVDGDGNSVAFLLGSN